MSNLKNGFNPDWLSPPGDTIADIIEEKGWTQAELATRLGCAEKYLNLLTNGKVALTADMAMGLERVFGLKVGFWLARETNYQKHKARIKAEENYSNWTPRLNKLPDHELIRINTLESGLSLFPSQNSNTGDLAPNTGDLGSNTGDLGSNTGDLGSNTGDLGSNTGDLYADMLELPTALKQQLQSLSPKARKNKVWPIIVWLCAIRSYKAEELAELLNDRNIKTLKSTHLNPLRDQEGLITYTHPEVVNHPDQAYETTTVGLFWLKQQGIDIND